MGCRRPLAHRSKRSQTRRPCPCFPGRLPVAMALSQQHLARASTLEQLRDKLETGDGPERKMVRLAEEQQRLMQQALQHNLLAMASQVPMGLQLSATSREDKQDLALSITSTGAASISVSVEVNGTLYSGMLFAQRSAAAMNTSAAAAPPAGPAGAFGILSSAHSPSLSSASSSSSKGPSSAEPSASGSP
ncbi:AT-rich interactive domain-containing protein 3A-like [Brienomyrus brachyistius]|uniref:AT-rich interactive domain-containing protein 3A-like n=1 Tax=Brienomyrus brachyistius TaxID=42636 RepID=UPI0020B37671|nr:AT-rich interactive domain-containing protein 3A-like [Brienomyrus brachyistius]